MRLKLKRSEWGIVVALALLGAMTPFMVCKSKTHQAKHLGFSSGSQRITTLLSEPVAPGDAVTTGVNLPAGTVADPASIAVTGEFDVVQASQVGTWFSVTAKNTGSDARPFAASITYGATP